MPRMNGRELAERVQGRRPGMKVIFMSGYPAELVAQRGIIEKGMPYLQKPLELGRLSRLISEVLGR